LCNLWMNGKTIDRMADIGNEHMVVVIETGRASPTKWTESFFIIIVE